MSYLNQLKSAPARAPLFFDAETLPIVTDEIRAEVAVGIQPPGNMSKPETIAIWEQTRKPELVEQELARGGLDATRGRLLTFSYAFGDAEPVCLFDLDEAKLLHTVLEIITGTDLWVGHNVAAFDLPFIRQRCWANGLSVPARPFKLKGWDGAIFDTMLAWSPDRDKRISLDRLCRVLGVVSPKASGFTGADVWPAYVAGRLDDIVTYALADVVATRECWKRMQ
jgi:3'-5' exonuclease